jgi:hypothetical protein
MTSPVDTSVKFLWSTQGLAPGGGIPGVAGALITLLDAFLVNGWGNTTVTSVSIAGGFCTLNFATTNPAIKNSVILVSGATGAFTDLNGEQKVTSFSSTSVTFATALTGTVTGSLSFMMAPAGYSKVYSGTNLAAYRSNDTSSTQHFLRVDDTGTSAARVVMYESMTDVNTGTNPYPTSVQFSGGLYAWKSSVVSATVNPYFIASNGKKILLGIAAYRTSTAGTPYSMMMFGDATSYKAADAYRSMILASTSNTATNFFTPALGTLAGNSTGGAYMARLHTGLGTSQPSAPFVTGYSSSMSGGASNTYGPYPSPVDSSLVLVNPLVYNGALATNGFRGYVSGFYASPQVFPSSSFSDGDLVAGSGDTAGKSLTYIWTGSAAYSDSSYNGGSFIDVTGPWAA